MGVSFKFGIIFVALTKLMESLERGRRRRGGENVVEWCVISQQARDTINTENVEVDPYLMTRVREYVISINILS